MDESTIKGLKLLESKDRESSDAAIREIRDDIKSALIKHFSSCGEITDVMVPGDSRTGGHNRIALVYIRGEGAVEKTHKLKLSGGCECDVKGCKIVVDKVMPLYTKGCPEQCGYTVPARYTQKAKMTTE